MGQRPHSDWPIVVGGCPRSGTSLVRRILNSHSRIHCGPEVKFFADLYGERFHDPWPVLRFIPTAQTLVGRDELLEVLGAGFIELHERAARAAGKARWADKVPENALYWPQWQRLLGDQWWFVHVVRNPLDTVTSIRQARFIDLPTELTAQILRYRQYLEVGSRFAAEHPGRYRRVVYEELVQRPCETVGALMDSLGERFETQQLAFNSQPHQTGVEDSKIAATTEVHRQSLNRWPSVLSRSDAKLIWDRTNDLWSRVDPDRRLAKPPVDREELKRRGVVGRLIRRRHRSA